MFNPFKSALNWIATHFRKDASKMLIWTGVAGWTLSSLAQISAVMFNPKLSKEQKSFLVPQEIADAVVNSSLLRKLLKKVFLNSFLPVNLRLKK